MANPAPEPSLQKRIDNAALEHAQLQAGFALLRKIDFDLNPEAAVSEAAFLVEVMAPIIDSLGAALNGNENEP